MMTTGKTHILLSEANQLKPIASAGPWGNAFPATGMDFGSYADELTWTLGIAGVAGTPDSWTLGAKFQYCIPHTIGYQYSTPRWFDLQPENIETNVVEGVGWYGGALNRGAGALGGYGIVASSAEGIDFGAAPRTIQRTIRHFGMRTRLLLDPQFVNGTSPGVKVSLTVFAKGA